MPLFIKKENEPEQFIEELKGETQQETPQTKQDTALEGTIQPRVQLQATQKKGDQLPKGTFTISVVSGNFEFARFTIKPEIFTEAVEMIKNLLQTLNEPQLKLNSNCDCIWCQQKIKELQDYLLS
jgi:hypothetical protein